MGAERDAVDELTDQWRDERPDVDVSPMHVVGRVLRLARVFERRLKDYFATHDLERWEFDVLASLRRAGAPYELTAGALLKSAMVTSGAITNRIDRLEARGFVRRAQSPSDRRLVRVRLTDAGREVVDAVLVGHVANEETLLAPLSPVEREALAGLLRTLLLAHDTP
ncbi:MarR family winged helix-turn-helix transcriptional regulator [Saccharothrix variisporea]|uniref:MarR family transcriptional regulator n=1 Tax=Saccharothrix variisporea TaxID=543527 RepID=A0A495XBX7_9PSEU|nr:MarR family transcriptional regulator [Saccharothrix variisporea]RKT69028.1 MarR family transcriptional regulator [Saccharothrix variisporea]